MPSTPRKEAKPIPRPSHFRVGGRSVMEIVAGHRGDTWRAVYTVRFRDAVYVLHAFQKKSKSGIATPQKEIELIRRRLMEAGRDYRERQNRP